MEKPELEMDKICRLCLQNLQIGALVNLFAVNFSIRPSDMIVRCASVQIYEKDGLPGAICNDCFYKLGMAYEFRNRCEASDQKLRALVHGSVNGTDQSPVVETDDIYEAMNAIFGPESTEEAKQGIFDVSVTENDRQENKSKTKNVKKMHPVKKRAQLDELLAKHKAKVKVEGKKINIFKTKRKVNSKASKKGTQLKEPECCTTCGKSFNYSGYLKAHQRIHSGEKPFQCEICHRKFTQSSNLHLHLKIHSDERRFQCEICSKLFRTSSNLHSHRKIHSKKRDFSCTTCERSFRTPKDLRNHIITHSAVKHYVCRLCPDKSFHRQSYLNSHVKTVHIGVKRHRCQDCGKIFSNSSNLIAHRRVHSGDRPFACEVCDAKFTQSPTLQRHIKAKHRPKPVEPPVPPESIPDTFEPAIDIDENRSLESAASSELSVATSLIDENPIAYSVPYMTNYLPTHHQQPPPPPPQMLSNHHSATASVPIQMSAPIGGNMYSGEPYHHQFATGSNATSLPTHHYQHHQQHMDMGSYDMCYSMPTHSVLNTSLINPQPTYIFDQ
ncbi:zinc finger protein 1 homolog [Sabethes cyaneus]|uniref:zinc finger protein 1 homolog n=1 Tax=Sabethes cyaneus TaxID=53552 RepID=UPI00237DF5B3|nr:zinc finger protein 1 homolog [Sabethes cyaneus]